MQARWLRLTVRDSRTPTTRTQKLSRRLLRNDRGPCRASRRAAVTSLFIRTPIRSQTNRKFYAPVSLLPENVVYRGIAPTRACNAASCWRKSSSKAEGPALQPGLRFRRTTSVLEAGELVVQASADHAEVVAVAAVVAKADKLAVEHRRAGVGHADHVAASEEAVVIVAMTVEVDVQAFDLDGQVVGEGVLDAAADRISDVIVVAIVAEEAEAVGGPRDEAPREGSARSGNVVVEASADEGRAVRDARAEGAEVVAT